MFFLVLETNQPRIFKSGVSIKSERKREEGKREREEGKRERRERERRKRERTNHLHGMNCLLLYHYAYCCFDELLNNFLPI